MKPLASDTREMPIVDLDDISTWPSDFQSIVEATAAEASEDDWFGGIPAEAEAIAALSGSLLRAYHCTRLTRREVLSVREQGLQPLSKLFTLKRIENAVADGYLTEDEGELYSRTTLPSDANRAGRVWLLAGRMALSSGPQIGYLVEVWGGEGVNMAFHTSSAELKRLESIGTPTVVVALIQPEVHYGGGGPGILTAAVEQLRTGAGGTSIRSVVPISGDRIESIEHPGGEFWDSHVWTPSGGFHSPSP